MRQALQFLTIIPVPAPLRPLGRAAWAFPLVGALLGLIAAACLGVGPMGPVLALISVAVCTGALHEDGLADVFDALRAGRSREKMHAILKDSRLGAYGAFAMVASFVWRWQALSLLHGNAWMRLPAVFGISRAMIVLLAATVPPAGDGLGRGFSDSLPRWAAVVAVLQLVALAGMCGWIAALTILLGNAVLLLSLRQWFLARLGGVNGDCLGAACQFSEAISLGILTWV